MQQTPMDTPMQTTFADCYNEVAYRGGYPLHREFVKWYQTQKYREANVHWYVFKAVTDYAYKVSVKDISDVVNVAEVDPNKHPLGDLEKSEVERKESEDFNNPFAFQHLFHGYLEKRQHLPTWDVFWNWLKHEAANYWYTTYQAKNLYHEKSPEQQKSLDEAFQWRMGKNYYSAVRELYLMAKMREAYGIKLKYHVLADVLLRCDFWVGDDIINLYIVNEIYKGKPLEKKMEEERTGRKKLTEKLFEKASPAFNIINLELHFKPKRGMILLPSDKQIEDVAKAIKARESRSIPL